MYTPYENNRQVDSISNKLTQLEEDIKKMNQKCHELLKEKQNQQEKMLTKQVQNGIELLEVISKQINTLSAELEAEITKFQEIAVEVNRDYHLLQRLSNSEPIVLNQSKRYRCRPLNIWEIHNSTIPIVVKHGNKFILTKRNINLVNVEQQSHDENNLEKCAEEEKTLITANLH